MTQNHVASTADKARPMKQFVQGLDEEEPGFWVHRTNNVCDK